MFLIHHLYRFQVKRLLDSLFDTMSIYKEAVVIEKLAHKVSYFHRNDYYRLWTYLKLFGNNQVLQSVVKSTLIKALQKRGSESFDSFCDMFQNKELNDTCLIIFKELLFHQFPYLDHKLEHVRALLAIQETTFSIVELAFILSLVHQDTSFDGYLILQQIQQNIVLPSDYRVNDFQVNAFYEQALVRQKTMEDVEAQKREILSAANSIVSSYLDKTIIEAS